MKTRNNYKAYILGIFSLLMLSSCASKKDVVYFQNLTNNKQIENQAKLKETVFSPNDLIGIRVLALDMSAVSLFNGNGVSGENLSVGATKEYLIDTDGFIDFPLLGNLKLAGLTKKQSSNLLKSKISEFVKDPIVEIELKNFKITVLGEVNSPGVFHIPNERVTILDALGMAGDMTINGERRNVLIIREQDGKKSFSRLDLTCDGIFKSDLFYLTQNDVVYIEPNQSKIKESTTNSTGVILSVVGILLSATTLILRNN